MEFNDRRKMSGPAQQQFSQVTHLNPNNEPKTIERYQLIETDTGHAFYDRKTKKSQSAYSAIRGLAHKPGVISNDPATRQARKEYVNAIYNKLRDLNKGPEGTIPNPKYPNSRRPKG